jgi:hypothetical protein
MESRWDSRAFQAGVRVSEASVGDTAVFLFFSWALQGSTDEAGEAPGLFSFDALRFEK